MRIRQITPLALGFLVPWAACNSSSDDSQAPVAPQTTTFVAGNADSIRAAEELAYDHIYEANPTFLSGIDEVWTRQVHIDPMGEAHTRLVQTVNKIPVFGSQSIVHIGADGAVRGITDKFLRDIDVDTTPVFQAHDAVDFAVDMLGGWDRVTGTPQADLQILRHQGSDYLTYRVQVDQFEDGMAARPVMFLDARTGDAIWQYNDLHTARDRRTYTANNGTSLPGTLVRSETTGPSGDAVLDQAHDNAGMTYDYYWLHHGRDSYTGTGATINSTVHYSSNYVNAFWNGSQMVYGDGDGVQSGPLTVLDVVGHELTHAVTDYSSDLIYSNESGALNEAMSDIFGAAIESYRDGAVSLNTWKVGEECWTPGTPDDALRYMYDPELGGDYDYYPTRYTGSSDNGGVHWNSGIANLAFYLMVEGGSHPRGKTSNIVPALDAANTVNSMAKAAAIFYRANTVYLTPSSNFGDARAATVNAATDLYGAGSAEVASVAAGWDAVGVLPPPDYVVIDTRSNLSGSTGDEAHFSYVTPSGATHIKFVISGGSGDADLYVKFGSAPTTSSYDCRPYASGNNETCEFSPAQQGTYYVMLRAYSSYSSVTLTVSSAGGTATDPEVCTDGIDNDGDGAVDCADSDCSADAACQTPAEVCDDGVDNDGDGAVDCSDSDCSADPVCAAPATSVSVGDLDGSSVSNGGSWDATVTILAVDNNGTAVSGATVSGSWSGGATGSGSCVTGSNGRCSVTSAGLRKKNGNATFTVGNVSHASLGYDATGNSDPDGDSNGTSITVLKP